MRKFTLVFLPVCLSLLFIVSSSPVLAQYTPIPVTGFNKDVVAEGTGNSAVTTTTQEMDAITPSNFVMCTKQFATANAFTPANAYGLPDNGTITTTPAGRTYQFASYTGYNALYLFPTDSGKLKLTTPARYTNISLLLLATENNATVEVKFKFTDGTTQIFNSTFQDWFSTTTTGTVLQGFGRIKRKAGPFTTADYEGGGLINPHMYSLEYVLPCSKTLDSIIFKNNSSTILTASNRAFVFAVSGVAGSVPVQPVINPVTLCSAGTTTLSVQNPPAGVTYTWFQQPAGGFGVGSGTTYTTPTLTTTTTYYVTATNALTGCASDPRVPVTVTVGIRPAAPVADSVNVCPGTAATITVKNPATGIVYNYYTTATGGTIAGTGTTYTTPVITANTTYYIEAVNTATGCTSTTRTAVKINFLPKLPAPVAQAATVGVNSVTFTWTAVAGAVGYQVSVNNGALQAPSSGATGLSHVANGLAAVSNVTFKVIALGPQSCQNSDTATATAKTLTDQVYIPNVFTPNGDGHNDLFKVYSNIINAIDMKIFNQWGESVFSTTDFNSGWNGTYKGKQQPVGVYVYVVKLRLSDGRELLKKGSINLVR